MDLVLHIGAHRTGSTLIEQAIAATLTARSGGGVSLWAPNHVRGIEGFQGAMRHFDDAGEPVDTQAAQALETLASRLAQDMASERAAGTQRLILSEENILGGMRNNLFSGEFYPDVAHRLRCHDSLLPLSPSHVALGVRDYGAVWASAYDYMPQSGQVRPSARQARGTLLDDKRGWPEVVGAIRDIWPDTPIIIWQQEQLSEVAPHVCSRMTGVPETSIVLPDGKVNARKKDAGGATLFTPEERKHLTHRYNRHMRRLRNDVDGLIWPGLEVA